MSRDDLKARRLVNLTLALLDARRPMTVAQIAAGVPGYDAADPSSAAFRRSFERDKEDLRGLGIELEVTGSANDEVGYRIVGSTAQLPPIELTAEEASSLALAASSWSLASMASLAERALVKVEAGSGTHSQGATPRLALQPRLDGEGPDLAELLRGVTARREVTFGYVTGEGERSERHLQPWGVVSWRRRWYLTGHDLHRDAQRTFRLSRISPGTLVVLDRPGAFEVPPGVDLRAQLDALSPVRGEVTATVAVRPGSGFGVREQGTAAGTTEGGDDLYEIRGSDLWSLAGWVRSFAGDVVPVDPPQLVELVRAGWERLA